MKNTISKISFFCVICLILLSASGNVFAYQAPTANAGPDLYVNSGQTIILQGSGYDSNSSNLTYYWNCNGGSLSSATVAQPIYTAPNNSNQNYSCSLTVTNAYSLSAYDNMIVYINSSGQNGNATLSIQKKVINLTTGNLSWLTSVNAKPSDVLSFAITLQAGNRDIHNVVVKDILPANLIYKGNLLVNSSLTYTGDPALGINIGTISAGNIAVVSYQAQVAPASNFVYGTTTLSSSATITSNELGGQTSSASVLVSNSYVSGATTISTGLTNNPVKDSFFLPMLLIVLSSWFYFSGNIYRFSDWLGQYM